MPTKKRKKLNLAVKRQFQYWLLTRIFGVIVLSATVAVLILYFYARQEISESFYTAHIQLRRVSDLLLPVIFAGALISLVSGMVLAFFLPQKIAGPIYRIQQGLHAIHGGDLTTQITLRRNDILTDVATQVNETAAELRLQLAEIKQHQRQLERIINTLENEEAAAAAARQKAVLNRLRT
ncbi:methyl-accepting chemotaxis protein [Desulfurivibrio alkaliphilus]|uniref:Putative methyl-accepting chemotaxis sensory transducer n=1 Tax=Desulfurivibrio alkaliphilus (strain DSM 19089 / UNIQEM U267 / AHT2) TaxID=589865 RepID=D6YZT7_DESAT|nr:methyl-accepting chemotaxis protein [Desulfurivibrio alkaliphilus]ADH85094.1 putative methyl-accepting chemotaxis sensory transducer [Desulfurivibrio alkaliphilus AHT 2]